MTEEKKKMSKGCMVAIIVVAFLIVAVGASMFYCYKNADKFVGIGLKAIAKDAQPYLPEDITEEMISEKIDKYMELFREKKIDGLQLQALMTKGGELVQGKEKGQMTEEELKQAALEFYEALSKAVDE